MTRSIVSGSDSLIFSKSIPNFFLIWLVYHFCLRFQFSRSSAFLVLIGLQYHSIRLNCSVWYSVLLPDRHFPFKFNLCSAATPLKCFVNWTFSSKCCLIIDWAENTMKQEIRFLWILWNPTTNKILKVRNIWEKIARCKYFQKGPLLKSMVEVSLSSGPTEENIVDTFCSFDDTLFHSFGIKFSFCTEHNRFTHESKLGTPWGDLLPWKFNSSAKIGM